MARKLKSDKLLFTATLLLVCTGVVMVYSASAVMAMQRFQNPYLFLVKQVAWAPEPSRSEALGQWHPSRPAAQHTGPHHDSGSVVVSLG